MRRYKKLLPVMLSAALLTPGIWGGGYKTVQAAPILDGLPTEPITYQVGAGPVDLAPNIEIAVDDPSESFGNGGYIRFEIDGGSAEHELLTLKSGETIETDDGAVTYDGTSILLDGEKIGSVHPALNGEGKGLRIDFSTLLDNGNFEEGDESSVPGWEINTNKEGSPNIWLDDLATKTKGLAYVNVEGAGPYTITGDLGDGQTYTFITDQAYTREGTESTFEGIGTQSSQGSAQYFNGVYYDGGTESNVLRIGFSGGYFLPENRPGDGSRGTAFGVEAWSQPFDVVAGDRLVFDWRGYVGGSDAWLWDHYEVYGFLVDTTTQEHTELMYGRGRTGPWNTFDGSIPSTGNYQFRFVVGGHDFDNGGAFGGVLEIDNIGIYSAATPSVTNKIVEALARLVTYESQFLTGELPSSEPHRTVNITAVNSANEANPEPAAVEINVVAAEPLALLSAVVEDETPNRMTLTFNQSVEGIDDEDLAGFMVNGVPVKSIVSIDGDRVVVELEDTVETGPLTIEYAANEGNVHSTNVPRNQLGDLSVSSEDDPTIVENNVITLELIKVSTVPGDPSQIKLKFNRPIAGDLSPEQFVEGFQIGGEPVEFVGLNDAGDEIIVRLPSPYNNGDDLTYNGDEGNIAADGIPANRLGSIGAGDVPVVNGKLNGLGLSLDGDELAVDPDFDPNYNGGTGEGYKTAVPNEVTNVSISPIPSNAENTVTTVSLNGTEIPQSADGEGWDWDNLGELQEGPNEVVVRVYDKDDEDNLSEAVPLEEYTITVWRASSKLVELNPSAGQLSPAFDSETEDYTMTVGNGTSQINWTPVALDPESTIEISVNNGPFTEVASGEASGNLALNVGSNTVVVKVTDRFDGTTKEYTVTVTRANANSGIYYPPVTPPASNKQTIPVDVVIGGDAGADITKIDIERTTHEDGRVTDLVTFTPAKAQEAVSKAAAAGEQIARIVIPATQAQADELQVDVPRTSLHTLQDNGIDLEIFTPHAALQVPNHSLDELDGDLYFRLVPVKDASAREGIAATARADQAVRQAANGNPIDVIGRPVTIETNMPSREVGLILPLHAADLPQDAEARQLFLEGLRVYADYEDGSKALVDAEVITLADGTLGLRLATDQFGTFTVLQLGDRTPGQEADGYHTAYIDGYTDGTFGPNRSATRAELAAMLDKLGAAAETASSGSGFPDVAASHWAARSIGKVTATGLMSGYPNGQFQPSGSITRAEMAVIAYNYLELSEVSGTGSFSDVGASHWAYGIVEAVQASGLMTGYADGTFKPSQQLTRAEAVTILNRMFNRGPLYGGTGPRWSDVPEGHWAYYDIDEASSNHAYALRPEGGEQWVGH